MASDVGCQKQPIKYISKHLKKVLKIERINVKISTPKGKGNPKHQKENKNEM